MRGIYAITNVLTDTVYYGQSKDIKERLRKHLRSLEHGTHYNDYLQNSWNKHGENAFVFTPIQIIEDTNIDLTPIEKKYTEEAYFLGLKTFNIRKPDKAPSHALETRKKISESNKGRIISQNQRKIHSERMKGENNPFFGKKHKPETLEINRKTHTGPNNSGFGKHLTEETKRKISTANAGKTLSESQKHSISIRQTGKHPSEETKQKLSKALTGIKRSNETKLKMSLAAKKRFLLYGTAIIKKEK